jgi:dethiobiotin synthetase
VYVPESDSIVNTDLFVTGTGTNVGKTLLSALLVAALGRKYWKPVQTGACEGTDRETVMKWAGVTEEQTYREAYLFEPPVSPHLAAEQKGTAIRLETIQRPLSPDPLVIEGAGGVLVPINNNATMLDLMRQLGAPAVVAARTALGTINHTLLTISAIRNAKLNLRGVVMIGEENTDNRRAIEHFGNVAVIGFIPRLNDLNRTALCSVFQQHFDRNAFA